MDAAQKKIGNVMGVYKGGILQSGKGGAVFKSREQAVAIAMSEAERVRKRRKGGLMADAKMKD